MTYDTYDPRRAFTTGAVPWIFPSNIVADKKIEITEGDMMVFFEQMAPEQGMAIVIAVLEKNSAWRKEVIRYFEDRKEK